MAYVAAFPVFEQEYMNEVQADLEADGIETETTDDSESEILAEIAEIEGATFELIGLRFENKDDALRATNEHHLKVADDDLEVL